MNVLFVYSIEDIQSPIKPLRTLEQIQFGISYISSFLKQHGHRIRLIVLSEILGKRNENIINTYFKKFYPGLICFTAVASEYRFIASIAKYIKCHYQDIYLLMGGPHASLNPEEIILDDFDALCIGEGENPTLELVSQLEKNILPSGIPNFWIKHGAKIQKNPVRQFLQELNDLPFPDREIWLEWIEEKEVSKCCVLLGRGCPFQCTYCCNHAFNKLAAGPYVRYRSPDNIVQEIKEIATRFPQMKEVYLEVETITINKNWAIELCFKLKLFNSTLNHPLSFGTNVRVTPNVNLENLFAAFKSANFRFINIGLESGSERIRREILRRNYSNQDLVNNVKLAKKHGLKVCLYNMVGLPGETMADFMETVRINRFCLPEWHLTSIFYPYPGTDLYSLCKTQELLTEAVDTKRERKKAVLDLPGFSKNQIQKSYIWFDYYVYKGTKPNYKILARVFVTWLKSKYYLNLFYRILTHLAFIKNLRNVWKEY
jgi:radical SAM superfamily enzyme YgiQ (UPF0313 family)